MSEKKEDLNCEKENDLSEEIKAEENVEITQKNSKKDKKKSVIKYIIYSLIVLVITCVVLWISLTQPISSDDSTKVYEKIPYFIQNINYGYLALFFGMVLLGFLINAFIMFLYAKMYAKHYKYHQALAIQANDYFYSSITPGAYGGEIAKVFVFKQQGIEISNAASMMVMNFIVYQTSLITIGLISLIFRFDVIMSIPAFPIEIIIDGKPLPDIPFYIFIILGFVLNVLTILLLLLMSSSRKLHNFVINYLINFLGKIKLVKHPEQKKEELTKQVENYRIELRRLRSNLPFAIVLFVITFIGSIVGATYPFFAGLTLNGFAGMDNVNYVQKFFDCIFFSNFHQMVTGLVPIPGTAGISEYVFDRLFGPSGNYFSEAFYSIGGANLLVVFWRLITFYLPFLLCGIVSATYKSRGIRQSDRLVPILNRTNTMTISFETIDERKLSLEEQLKQKQDKKDLKEKKKEEKNTNNIDKEE